MTPDQISKLLGILEGTEKIKTEITFNQASVIKAMIVVILGTLVVIILDRYLQTRTN